MPRDSMTLRNTCEETSEQGITDLHDVAHPEYSLKILSRECCVLHAPVISDSSISDHRWGWNSYIVLMPGVL